ncbi:50S ribosomal protein L11 methyltransferase [Solwaraspora sp. WMMD406]|uniref:methyltransferase domain-containing protein n=1 Tax=Solwaraspora sp. WMMD406 TaxID=3016095 RepID=UPI002415DA89|nr:50S ribosomal protein L11 methyltransferase [Solwaraspora sp. WMMD406]MDG4768611.1 50S ribosomal protein L11 methyltransferase [Solwaraspora sp. WMMD406]
MAAAADVPFTPDLHLRLLLSIDRGHNVQRAVRAAVAPGARVLDAGTGSGLLAMIAAGAGAGHVVAVDRHHVTLARTVAAHNGLADRITFHEADLAALGPADLGGRFDVLIAMIHTNHPLIDEERSRLVLDLRHRFGTPDCVVIPGEVRYQATGCERLDWDLATELTDLDQAGEALRGAYGRDFGPLVDAVRHGVAMRGARPAKAVAHAWRSPTRSGALRFPRGDVRLLTAAHDWVSFDYQAATFPGFPDEVRLVATTAGRLTGVIWTQQLRYAGQPLWTSESYSPLATARLVDEGQEVTLLTGDRWRATNILSHHQPT